LLRYFVTFFYCNLLQLQVTEKSNLLPGTSYYSTLNVPLAVMQKYCQMGANFGCGYV